MLALSGFNLLSQTNSLQVFVVADNTGSVRYSEFWACVLRDDVCLRAVRNEPVRLYTAGGSSLCFVFDAESVDFFCERDQASLGCIFFYFYFVGSLAVLGRHNDR